MKLGVVILAVAAFFIGGCAMAPTQGHALSTFSIATYNVDDFFGSADSIRQKGDHAKSPAAVKALAAAIHQVNADVLVLQEVQTGGLLADFNRAQLADMGYAYVAIDSATDARGLTLAVLSRLPITNKVSHKEIPLDPALTGADAAKESNHFARDLYRVDVRLQGGASLTIYDLHLKSTSDFTGDPLSGKWRMREAAAIARIIKDEIARDHLEHILVGGDFNEPPESAVVQTIRHATNPPLEDALDFLMPPMGTGLPGPMTQPSRVTFSYKNISASVDTVLVPRNLYLRVNILDTHEVRAAGSHRPVIVRMHS